MVLFKTNPDLKLVTITTFDGNKEYARNCKKIEEKYYLKDTQCIYLNSKWYAIDDKNILVDHETKEKFHIEAKGRRTYGVVEINNKDEAILGYFTPKLHKNVDFIDNKNNKDRVKAICESLFFKKDNFIENYSNGIWYLQNGNVQNIKKDFQKIINAHDWTNKKYNIEDNATEFSTKIKTYNEFEHSISESCNLFAKFLPYSFGIEFETAAGYIPEHIQHRHGVVACRDGSIGSAEFVTIPMEGTKGMSSIIDLCNKAKDRIYMDVHCSMHLHLGKFPIENRNLFVALYLLCIQIQDDVFDMLPPYKRHWEGFKRKNYCRELEILGIVAPEDTSERGLSTMVKSSFNKIFSFISDFKITHEKYREGNPHPSGDKWNIENRKTWTNFVNAMYSQRKTIEFRAHQATFNPVKTINWLFITSAILKYAEVNHNAILKMKDKIGLSDVLNIFKQINPEDKDAQFLSEYLNAYYDSRKEDFSKALKKKDFECSWDLKEDPNYDFKLKGRNLVD